MSAPASETQRAPEERLRVPGGLWIKRRWHAQNTQFYPIDPWLFYGEVGDVIRDFVVPGHTPPEPPLEASDRVITLGSCFAGELRKYLQRCGFASESLRIPEGLNNTYAILDFVSWAVTGAETGAGFRYDTTPDGEIREWTPEQTTSQVRPYLEEAGAFVFTLGLAEVWHDRESGAVFWRGVPEDVYDERRHAFRVTTVEENEHNIVRTIELVREVSAAPIVLTLSPVPLNATFRGISCVSADCVSKSTLRVAIDRVLARGFSGVYYWPSFEMVRWLGPHLPWPAYGFNRGDTRHVTRYLVAQIIDTFIAAFYKPAAVEQLRARGGLATSFERSPRSLRARFNELRRRFEKAGTAKRSRRRRSVAASG